MSSSAARRTMSLTWVSPSSSEYSVWLCKWTNAIVSPFDKVGGARVRLWCGYARCIVSCWVESTRRTRAQLAAPLPFRPLFRSVIFSAAMIPACRSTVCEQTVSFAWNDLCAESAGGRSSFLGVTRTTQDPPIYEDHLSSKNLAEIAIVSSAGMQNLLPDDPQPSHISPDIR